MIAEIAPAKINLYLHVGGLRPDRLHDLESFFVFADRGDVVTATPASDLSLDIVGPFAAALSNEAVDRNLVLRAARRLRKATGVTAGARLTLDKQLPIASGVGGGSADAAAALRALSRLWRVSLSGADLKRLAFSLGADIPACLDRRPVLVSGAGEALSPAPTLPPLWICLVNPKVAMPTGPVFRAFDVANPSPAKPQPASIGIPRYAAVGRLMQNSRNDLEPIAIARQSVIQEVIDSLAKRPGALAARMSGSGASVFGLFTSKSAAGRAANEMAGRGWWSLSAKLCDASTSLQMV